MFTSEEMAALYTRVLDRMVGAGWLHRYTFTEGSGYRLAWTLDGGTKAIRLAGIIDAMGLEDGDRNAALFDKFAHGERLPDGFGILGDIPDAVTRDWREAVGEIGVRGDEDGLLILVHIVKRHEPGLETPVEFG